MKILIRASLKGDPSTWKVEGEWKFEKPDPDNPVDVGAIRRTVITSGTVRGKRRGRTAGIMIDKGSDTATAFMNRMRPSGGSAAGGFSFKLSSQADIDEAVGILDKFLDTGRVPKLE